MFNRIGLRLNFAKQLALVAGLIALTAPVAPAQSGAPSTDALEFDAASVKLATPPPDGHFSIGSRFGPGQFSGEDLTMQEYIQTAYGVRGSEKIVGPDWLRSRDSVYNITAKAAGPAAAKELRVMLQHLLATRFQLKLHTEDRPAQIYALAVGGKGIKLAPVKFDGSDPNAGAIHITASGVEFQHASLALLAYSLSGDALGTVQDATGISGLFDFSLAYAKKGWDPDLDPPADSDQPSIFTAIEGIGLKLERRQGTVRVYVVDHVERVPVEN